MSLIISLGGTQHDGSTLTQIRAYYDKDLQKQMSYYATGGPRHRMMSEVLKTVGVPAEGTIADLGCGAGYSLVVLQKLGITPSRLLGVELSPILAGYAASNNQGVHVDTGDIVKWLEDRIEPLACALFLDSYEHIQPALYRRVWRALARLVTEFVYIGGPAIAPPDGSEQITDTPITQGSLLRAAVGFKLSHWGIHSLWRTGDYMQAILERKTDDSLPHAERL